MPQFSVSGYMLNYDIVDLTPPWRSPPWAPVPETILFHHGLGSTQEIWRGWLPALLSRYRIVTFDMRGHGASSHPGPNSRLDLDTLTDDVFAVLDATGTERAHLVGESIGGTIALHVALRAPERFHSLTVSNGAHVGASIQAVESWQPLLSTDSAAAWSAHMMDQRFHRGAISEAAWHWYESQQAACAPDVLLRGMRALVGADTRPRLAGLEIPVLLLHPDASPFIPVSLMADFRNALPHARLHVVGNAKHGLPFSHATTCAALLAAFLAETAIGR